MFERGAQVWRGPSRRRECRGGDSDDSLDALDGERELFVAAQSDDDVPRPFAFPLRHPLTLPRPFVTLLLAAARAVPFGLGGVRFAL